MPQYGTNPLPITGYLSRLANRNASHPRASPLFRRSLGAEHAGWKFGWRDAPIASDPGRRYVETYCYAFAGRDFLEDEVQ
jgi:hypothetical protein